jgi:nitrite reductase (NO-forming)
MLENITTPLNHNRTGQNLAILAAAIAAITLFILTVSNLGLFRFGSSTEFVSNNGLLVQTEDFKFTQDEIRLTADTDVQFALLNSDILPHSFDVDALDIHIAMAARNTAETTLTMTQPGTYTFYCAIPGHREAGMVGTLIVEP